MQITEIYFIINTGDFPYTSPPECAIISLQDILKEK